MMDDKPERVEKPRRRIPLLAILGGAGVVVVVGLAIAMRPQPLPESEQLASPLQQRLVENLRPVADFASIADIDARSVALFAEASRVIESPRCMNCHPRTDMPTQTDAMRLHMPPVERGADGGGARTLRCSSCHHEGNFEASGVPGAHHWKLAPIEMGWQGKTPGEICRQIQDPSRGGMTREALLHHMAEDELVAWAWRPGGDRAPAPGTQAQFGEIIRAWLETGGKCPA